MVLITDASGSSIQGVSLTFSNSSTREQGTAELEEAGFKCPTRDAVNLDPPVCEDARIKVGDGTQPVRVSAQATLLQTDNTAFSLVVEGRKVPEAALNGRIVMNPVTLTPSVISQYSFTGSLLGYASTNPFIESRKSAAAHLICAADELLGEV